VRGISAIGKVGSFVIGDDGFAILAQYIRLIAAQRWVDLFVIGLKFVVGYQALMQVHFLVTEF
jgi:hypothetical protein